MAIRELLVGDARHVEMDVDAVQQRPADPLLVTTFTPAAQLQARRGSPKEPQGHVFVMTMNTKRVTIDPRECPSRLSFRCASARPSPHPEAGERHQSVPRPDA
jgi:hypothetical protein